MRILSRVLLVVASLALLLLVGAAIYLYQSGPALPPDTDDIISRAMADPLPEFVSGRSGRARSGDLAGYSTPRSLLQAHTGHEPACSSKTFKHRRYS
jgi:hypothetical protein